MTKFEKAIAGLQRCCVDNCTEGSKCPYYSEKDCLTTLLYDALELLKKAGCFAEGGDQYFACGRKVNGDDEV